MALARGLILADRGTVTGMAAAAGIGQQWRRACWFFAAAKWDPDALGLAVAADREIPAQLAGRRRLPIPIRRMNSWRAVSAAWVTISTPEWV